MSEQPHDTSPGEPPTPVSPSPAPSGSDNRAVLIGILKIVGLMVLASFVMLAVLFGLLAALCGGW